MSFSAKISGHNTSDFRSLYFYPRVILRNHAFFVLSYDIHNTQYSIQKTEYRKQNAVHALYLPYLHLLNACELNPRYLILLCHGLCNIMLFCNYINHYVISCFIPFITFCLFVILLIYSFIHLLIYMIIFIIYILYTYICLIQLIGYIFRFLYRFFQFFIR